MTSKYIIKYSLFLIRILTIYLLCFYMSSCKTLKIEDIDKKFADGKYFESAEDYRTLYRKTSPKKKELRMEIAYKMGEAYRILNNPARAVAGYENALRYGADDETIHLQYARTLHKLGRYKDAQIEYEKFLKSFPDNQFALNGLEGAKAALQIKGQAPGHKVTRMTSFDLPKGSSFAPALLPTDYEQVFFTSNAGKDVIGDTISSITGLRNNDIFMSRKNENGVWMKPEHLQSAVNTIADEGVVSFNAQGTAMYYTYAPIDSVSVAPASIYISRRSGGSWEAGQRIEISKNDSVSVFAHPAINPSDDFLYFVSDMPGGYGGKDIWRAKMFADQIEYIENLGPQINTAGDEMFPYMRTDSTLYFASDGHVGLGGLDIYKATYIESTNQWTIENLGIPINSSADDFGITFGKTEADGFFSSNRDDAKGLDHIYVFSASYSGSLIDGYIVDTDDDFINDATIHIVGKEGTNTKIKGKTDGTYQFDVKQGVDYVLLGTAPNHLNARMALKTVATEKDSIYYVDFVLIPIFKPVVLENIFFEFNKATLLEESKEGLDGLIEILQLNPHVAIELSAHTDRKGSDEYNNSLSKRRAEAVVNYLIQAGKIKPDRLTSAGKGKTEPKTITKGLSKKYDFLNEGDILTPEFIALLDEEQQAIADQLNRRTEFKVSSITYGLE